MKKLSVVLVLGLLLLPSITHALDYKVWIPLVPKTLDNLSQDGDPDGMNMEMSGQKWSSLCQDYAGGGKSLNLCVFAGMAPQAMQYQGMFAMNMSMETEEQVMKTVLVSGHKVLLMLEKKEKTGTAVVDLGNSLIAVLNVEFEISEDKMVKLVEMLPLSELKNSIK